MKLLLNNYSQIHNFEITMLPISKNYHKKFSKNTEILYKYFLDFFLNEKNLNILGIKYNANGYIEDIIKLIKVSVKR